MVLLPELAVEGRLVVVEGRVVAVVVEGRCVVATGRLAVVGRLEVVAVGLTLLVVGRDEAVEDGRTLLVVVTRLEEAPAVLVVVGLGVRELIDPAVLLRRTVAT